MKTKFLTATILLILITSCDLTREDFDRITPDNFYKTVKDAELAIAALDSDKRGIFGANEYGAAQISDVSAGDMYRGTVGTAWDRLIYHQWTEARGDATVRFFPYYNVISKARIIVKQIEAMDIPEDAKVPLIAEANAIAGWLAFICYDMYGPMPHPTDEMLANPQGQGYPSRPTYEEYVQIIEEFFSNKNELMDPDFGSYFGRTNKGIANFVLMELYMLEAGRTGDANFYRKAQSIGEEIISSGWYELQKNYLDVFRLANKRNREIIFAPASDYSFGGNVWHAETLPNNYPCALNRGAGAWAVYRMLWSFYDTFDKNDLRLGGILTEYVAINGTVINRQNPYDPRHGVAGGPFAGLKYDIDDAQVGYNSGHDLIIYRYAGVILLMAEILNELGINANVNAPIMQQVAKDGTILNSDGGTTTYSFLNAIRVRAGLEPLLGLSKDQLRDSILMERGHELYAEGFRRRDLIRYQRVTNGGGYKIFDKDPNYFLWPIPVSYINEFRGNLIQNEGY